MQSSDSSLVPKKDEANQELFKMPSLPMAKKKKPRLKVLDEDTYIEEMSKIIQRDFFPDLEKLKAQNEFLDATDKKDYQRLRELYIKYSGGQRPPTERYASPATFETPRSEAGFTPAGTSSDHQELRDISMNKNDKSKYLPNAKPLISPKHTLDSYLSTYTSEDNNSFQDLMEDMWERSKAKFSGQLEEEYVSHMEKIAATVVPSIEEQANQVEKSERLNAWTYKAKNYIMYVPDGEEPPLETVDKKKQILYSNTRMDSDPFDYQRNKEAISQIARTQEKVLCGRIGVDGSTLLDSKNKQGLSNLSASTHAEEGIKLLPTAHSFVRTPSPCPGAPGESPLMTWGQIEGTPFRLDGGDTPLPFKGSGTSFKMADTSKREQIGLALAEKAGQRMRSQKKKAMEAAKRSMLTPSPRLATGSTTERLAMMSPAAQKLATASLKTHLIGISSPSPKLTPGHKSTPRKFTTPSTSYMSSKNTTPIVSRRKSDNPSTSNQSNEKKSKKNLTDDLLRIDLPQRKRLKAVDFFN